jgi:hypothetical protein
VITFCQQELKGNRVGAFIILSEDGNRSSFGNIMFCRNIRRWTKSKNMILPSATHRGQNLLERSCTVTAHRATDSLHLLALCQTSYVSGHRTPVLTIAIHYTGCYYSRIPCMPLPNTKTLICIPTTGNPHCKAANASGTHLYRAIQLKWKMFIINRVC